MADTIGQFFKEQRRHQDTVDPNKVTPPPPLSVPMPVQPLEPSPKLSVTASIGPLEQPPALSTPVPPGPEALPNLSVPATIPFEPAPPLDVPAVIPFEPAPPLDVPPAIDFEPPPALSVTATIPFEDAPPLTLPVAPTTQSAPDPGTPATITYASVDVDTAKHEDDPSVIGAEGAVPPEPLGIQGKTPTLGATGSISYPVVDVDTRFHSDDPKVAKAGDGTSTGNTVLDNLTSLNLGVNTAVMVPGLGMVPLNTHLSTAGGKFDAGFDFHLKDALNQRITQLKGEAQDAAARFASENLRNLGTYALQQVKSLANGNGFHPGMPVFSPFVIPEAFKKDALLEGSKNPLNPTGGVTANQPSVEAQAEDSYNQRVTTNLFVEDGRAEDYIPRPADLQMLNDPNQSDPDAKRAGLVGLFSGKSYSFREFVDPLKGQVSSSYGTWRPFNSNNNGTDEDRGFFRVRAQNSELRDGDLPTDANAYVPLVFTDLRPLAKGGVYRSVYFRSFLTGLSEQFAPNWNMQQFFGRVDPVATYQSTNRTLSVAFKVVTFTPEELDLNYKKLAWLKSMVYPQYDAGMQFYAGPVVRMRVGDVINAIGKEGNRGLAGVITNMGLDYGEATWELLNGRRLPREITVSVSFHVLHDNAVGIIRGTNDDNQEETQFGGIERVGKGMNANYARFHSAFVRGDYLNRGQGIAEAEPLPNEATAEEK